MATPRIKFVRRTRRMSRLLAWLLAPWLGLSLSLATGVGTAAYAQTVAVPAPGALPQGGQVRVGAGQISQIGQLLLIQQTTPRLGIDWQRFDIGSGATVEFRQPGASSVALNRIVGQDPSAIFGRLQSNGQVFLTNPNGVLFAPGSRVDVGGLVASTLDLSQADFAAGHYDFRGDGGTVQAQGHIRAPAGGYVALFGGTVDNAGEIEVAAGSVVLASGRAATVSVSDSGLLSAVLTPGQAGAVHNSGRVSADGGVVRLSAQSAEGVAASLVNNSGIVRANGIVERGGEIHITGDRVVSTGELTADGRQGAAGGRIVVRADLRDGAAQIGGRMSARALDAGGAGGSVETSAASMSIDADTRVDTRAADGRHGQWLIDPTDFVVSAGGGAQTTSGIGAATLAANLDTGSVTLQTAPEGDEPGNIRIEAAVSWAADTTLTLSAAADVDINASLTATGNAAGLTISAGSGVYRLADGVTVSLPGSSPSLSINGRSFLVVNSLDALQAIGADATSRGLSYALGSDIDASATVGWNEGAGFVPLGSSSSSNAFRGDFEGLGHTISGLTIDRPGTAYVGLFGYAQNALISHLHLDGGSISGGSNVGAVVGYLYGYNGQTDLRGGLREVSSNLPVSAHVPTSTAYAGGLVGRMEYTQGLQGVSASGAVDADTYGGSAGGIVGFLVSASAATDLVATGPVTMVSTAYGQGYGNVGGIAGYVSTVPVRAAQASGAVQGGSSTGGLVGYIAQSSIEDASATGSVFSTGSYAGGLVGESSSTSMTRVQASGDVFSQGYGGGLAGYAYASPIASATASGAVVSTYDAGGLVGIYYQAAISNSAAHGDVQSINSRAGGLAGYVSQSTLSDVAASGTVTADDEAGGLVGRGDYSPIINGQASGQVTSLSQEAGGLVGRQAYANIVASAASGDVRASTSDYVGGLVGVFYDAADASIRDSRASGDVLGGGYGGGLVGYATISEGAGVVGSQASGDVNALYYAGGLIGYLYTYLADTDVGAALQGNLASGHVRGGQIAGGLIGYWQGYEARLSDNGATGSVTVGGQTTAATLHAGGLIGQMQDDGNYEGANLDGLRVERSFASGDVSVDASRAGESLYVYAGGLIGEATRYQAPADGQASAVVDSYASGRVEVRSGGGYTAAGGLVGANTNVDILRSYSSGAVVDAGGGNSDTVGGLLGSHSGGTVTDSVWNLDFSGQASSAAGTGLSDAEMRQAASFTPWDLATGPGAGSIWRLYEGHSQPLLTTFLRPLTLQQADAAKTYDGSHSLAGTGLTDVDGSAVPDADRVLVAGAGPGVGSWAFTATDLYSTQLGYDLTVLPAAGSSTLTIGARTLTLTGTVADKVYDRSTAASFVATPVLTGLLAGDDLTLDLSAAAAAFTDVNVGVGKTVNVSGYLVSDGAVGRAANYSVQGTALADITPAPVSAGGFAAVDRVYDGSTGVAVDFSPAGSLSGVIGGDAVGLDVGAVAGTMADRHVGIDKPVAVSGITLSGAQAGNYQLVGIDAVTVDITPKPLAVTGLLASNKTYNASTSVSINAGPALLQGLLADDRVVLSRSGIQGNTADKNAGTGLAVTVTGLTLVGPEAGNYAPESATLSVDVARRDLYIYAYGSNNEHIKVYDGNNTAAATVYESNSYSADDLVVAWDSITYADKNVAYNGSGQVANKLITVAGITVGGDDAGNYTLRNTEYSFNGRIDPRPLAVTGVSARDRVYDGTPDVTVDLADVAVDTSDIVAGDTVSVSVPAGGTVTGTMADKRAGTNKAVTVPGLTLTGDDAPNYTFNAANGVSVDIAPKALTVSYSGIDRVYDGSVYAFVSASADGIVAGDDLSFYTNYYCQFGYCGNAVFTGDGARNVGTDKPVSVTYEYLYGADAGNYTIDNYAVGGTTASVTPRPITPVVVGVDKVYDGSTAASVTLDRRNSNIVTNDVVDVATSAAQFTGDGARNVGTGKAVEVSAITLSGADAGNYALASDSANTTASITPKPVSVSGVVAVDRVYDGTLTVAVTAGTPAVVGLVEGDDATPVLPPDGISSGTLLDRHVGQDKPVTVTGLTLEGADAANYTLTGGAGTVNITPLGIAITYTGLDKVYDGSTAASVVGSAAALIDGDIVGFSQQAAFIGDGARNAGANKSIAITDIALTGAQAGNYALLETTAGASASITPKPITASYTGVSRVYNGVADRSAVVIGGSTGLVAGDSVGFNQTARFSGDGSAGANKPIDVTDIALAGVNAGNYVLGNTSASTQANITPRALGVSGLTAIDRVYDGTLLVQVDVDQAQVDLTGVLGSDEVTVSLPPEGLTSGTMLDRHVGADKPVGVTGLLLGGASAANYTLAGGSGLTVTITPAALTAVYTGLDKVYDGGTAAGVLGASADLLAGDNVGIAASGRFSDGKNVGSGKAVEVFDAFLTGIDRQNYTLANPSGQTTADITPRPLTALYAGGTRAYDGGVEAPVSAVLAGLVGGDAVQAAQTAVFTGDSARNVGQNKPIAISGIAIDGADAGNYALTTDTAAAAGSITPKPIVIEGLTGVSATDRVYDGSTVVAVTVPDGISGQPREGDVIAGDSVVVSVPPPGATTGNMADRHVGTGKAVVISGLGLSGPDAGNYLISGASGVTVDITPLDISASYTGVNKVYDGTALASVVATSTGFFVGDDVAVGASGVFDDGKDVGVAKAVTVSSGLLAGADAGNYTLANPDGSTSATITPRTVTAVYSGGTRVYDGGVQAPVSGTLDGAIDGDALGVSQSAAFTGAGAKNVGTDKPVAVADIALDGADAGNYQLAATATTTTASITPRPIVVDGLSVTATDRVYDGTTDIAVELLSADGAGPRPGDLIAGDDVSVAVPPAGTSVGILADKHAGVDKAVVVAGLTLSGADAANYTVVGATGLTVTISPRTLTAVWTGVDKVYDGTDAASVSGSTSDLLAGDSLLIQGSGVFSAGKNVGSGLAIAVSAGSLSGDDAQNYVLANADGIATAAITPLTVSAAYSGLTRVYDGGIAAPVSGTLVGAIDGDDLLVSQVAAFTGPGSKNVGTDKPVAVTGIAIAGTDAANYRLEADSAITTASITPRPLTVSGLSGLSAVDRVYDGEREVALTGAASGDAIELGGLITGDAVALAQAGGAITRGTMADKHAGQGKAVVVDGLSLTGADAGNYTLGGVLGLTVNIAPRPVSVTGLVALGRVYDGSIDVTLDTRGGAIDGLLAGDDLSLLADGATGTMADRHAGLAKAVTLAGVAVSGADAGNYALQPASPLTVDITPRLLTLTASAQDKVYDGDLAAQLSLGDDRFADDVLAVTHQSARFASAGVGSGKAVAVEGLALTGDDAANYRLDAATLNLLADITPRALTLQATAQFKVYGEALSFDGTEFSASGLVAGETVGGAMLASAGSAAAAGVAPYAITLSGAAGGSFDPANYLLAYVPGTLTVAPRSLTVASNTVVRYADEPNPASFGFSTGQGGLVNGDRVVSVLQPVPAGSADAPGGSVFELRPQGAAFDPGQAANYELRYASGLLIVLPRPPRIGDIDAAGSSGEDPQFAVVLDPAELAAAEEVLRRNSAQLRAVLSVRAADAGVQPDEGPLPDAAAADILAGLLRGKTEQVTLPTLLRLPLISWDPALRQRLQGGASAPGTTSAPATPSLASTKVSQR